ncbi:MAG: hypothetical protein J6S85_18185 [Methanobrevibacter sp.]|nr:hypothetical protein [Methanobrevibacter sp.]
MDFNKVRELLKGLITDSTPTEEVEKIGKISGEIDNLEKEEQDFLKSHEDLRKKYIEVIKDTSFKGAPKEEDNPQPKTLEECFKEQIEKRKD